MCGHTRFDKIRNEVIRDKVEVTSIEDKIRETRLRRFGHIRSVDASVRIRKKKSLLYTIKEVEVNRRTVESKLLDTI